MIRQSVKETLLAVAFGVAVILAMFLPSAL